MTRDSILIVNSVADDPFAIDVAHHFGQASEISDLISLKLFANSEFCPRFISIDDETDTANIGDGLRGKSVVIVNTCGVGNTRNALAMRLFLVARAAKDNGAGRVILVEPDLFYSAQDRGPRPEHGEVAFARDLKDRKKFDGQPFSSDLYSKLLHASGVDEVVTVHNHSISVQRLFAREFNGRFYNLSPAELYCDYLLRHEINHLEEPGHGFLICAPDAGATPFATEVYDRLQDSFEHLLLKPAIQLLTMEKVRSGERKVAIHPAATSPTQAAGVRGQDVIVFDDMVRTGHTIRECCHVLKELGARRVVYVVTHFHSSDEVKENLNDPAIDEIITTNTLPLVLNRDMQGRLRKKMLVLKIEKWIASFLLGTFVDSALVPETPPYAIDISSKNPRWLPHVNLKGSPGGTQF
ncbi:MAG: phosphoribosyltransferase family protein [Lentisphaeria bacterium]|jgi:ribose-phosphate pyrophosphokinase